MKDLQKVIQGRLNRYRGRTFELRMIRVLRRHGFTARRVNEADGYTRSVDILIFDTAWGIVPVQCKRTQTYSDGFRGLRACRAACSVERYPLAVCFFNFYGPTPSHGSLYILVHRAPMIPNSFELMNLKELISLLRDRTQALLAPPPSGTM